MSDFNSETVRQTGTVMTELVAKAKEARVAGHSRRDFFARSAKLAGATALGAAGINLVLPIAAKASGTVTAPSSDTVAQILDIACTAEALAITLYYHALQHTAGLPDVNSLANQNYFQAALTQEYEHLVYLKSLGGAPLTTTFYFPTNMFNHESVFFPTALTLEGYFISAYLAAAMDFSGSYSSNIPTASPTLIGAAVQIFGVECEHRALLGVAGNVTPPNNVIAEVAELTTVAQATGPLTPFISSGGTGFDTTPFIIPSVSNIESMAGSYGPSFFPTPKYV